MPHQSAARRHHYVFHQRGNNLAERRADDYPDSHIHYVATHGKFLEFLEHGLSPLFFDEGEGRPRTDSPGLRGTSLSADYIQEKKKYRGIA